MSNARKRISLVIVLLMFLGLHRGIVLAADIKSVEIEAQGNVNYDINTNITTANKKVKLTSEELLIEAEQLIYDGNLGLAHASGGVKLSSKDGFLLEAEELDYDNNRKQVKASGGVKLTSKDNVIIEAKQLTYDDISGEVVGSGGITINNKQQAVYQTEAIQYNLKDGKGKMGSVNGDVVAESRNYLIKGERIDTEKDITNMSGATITRCPKPSPDYLFIAKSVKYNGKNLYLKHVFLYVKGIPVFYFPFLNLNTNNQSLPNVQPGYTDEEGLNLKFEYSTPVENHINWRFRGDLSTKGDKSVGVGLGTHYGDLSNYLDFLYNLNDSTWVLGDQAIYDTEHYTLILDGSHFFSSSEETQYGFSVTRKYWDGLFGRWQFGILGRKVSAKDDDSGLEYGGTYGGYRLDYNPIPHLTFSLLRLDSFTDGEYQEFMSDYKIGSNWLYNIDVPINPVYSFGLDGTYNSDQSLWIHQIYRINRETDCFKVSVGWDEIPESWIFNGSIKF